MTDPLRALLDAGAVAGTSFPPTSRYAQVGVATWEAPAGPGARSTPVTYLRRRLCPAPEQHALLHEYRPAGGERRDTIAASQLGDAELWWRLADANGVLDPRSLTEQVGRLVRITLQAGIPGAPGDR